MRYMTYDEIWNMILKYELPPHLKDYEWYGVSRAGTVLAFMLSVKYGRRPMFIDPKMEQYIPFKKEQNGTPKYKVHDKVLLIDDILTTGENIRNCAKLLQIERPHYESLCFLVDPRYEESDYCILETTEFIIMPWDAYDVTDLMGFDFDGVICQEKEFYIKHKVWLIKRGYEFWMTLFLLTLRPLFYPQGNYVIVTSRPEKDRPLVQAWLKRYKIKPMGLLMAPTMFKTSQERCEWKRDMLIKHKITSYIDNDKGLCDYLIAQKLPKTFIYYYDGEH